MCTFEFREVELWEGESVTRDPTPRAREIDSEKLQTGQRSCQEKVGDILKRHILCSAHLFTHFHEQVAVALSKRCRSLDFLFKAITDFLRDRSKLEKLPESKVFIILQMDRGRCSRQMETASQTNLACEYIYTHILKLTAAVTFPQRLRTTSRHRQFCEQTVFQNLFTCIFRQRLPFLGRIGPKTSAVHTCASRSRSNGPNLAPICIAESMSNSTMLPVSSHSSRAAGPVSSMSLLTLIFAQKCKCAVCYCLSVRICPFVGAWIGVMYSKRNCVLCVFVLAIAVTRSTECVASWSGMIEVSWW